MPKSKCVLALESGAVFTGESIGFKGERTGEVVFNTSMTGYQEILTDPSYKGQIIVMTEPHIGNVGVNLEDQESRRVFCEGFIIRDASPLASNWRSKETLEEYLIAQKLPALAGIDTRRVVKILREVGVMRGIISATDFNPQSLLKKIKDSPEMSGQDLVKTVTTSKEYQWEGGSEWNLAPQKAAHRIVALDFGIKHNILRCLTSRGCDVTAVPAQTSVKDILALNPSGIFLSNGPGDPAAVTYGIETARKLIQMQESGDLAPLPVFGICLGHQILGHAFGGKTYKLKFGHRGANHPVKNLKTEKIEITTQNHGFAVDAESLAGKNVELTHVNLNDNTLEGMQHKKLPIFSVQYHPESSAGPHDSRYLFDDFLKLIAKHSKKEIHA